MKIASSIADLIGRTPLLRLANIEKKFDIPCALIAKLERANPGGSAKDRVALSMITDAEEKGLLAPGGTIIEPTSGNTGIGLAAVAASKGYKVVLTMPDTMSEERRNLLKAFGAQLILTPGAEGMNGAIKKAESLAAEIPGSIIAGQFYNPANPAVHYRTTGPEIWTDLEGNIDIFVACVGSGGTLSGAGRYLKEKNDTIKIIAVEPSNSAVLSGGQPGPHKIQGIGAGFIPENLHQDVVDSVIPMEDERAFEGAKLLAKEEGLLSGISSGAALMAAIELAKQPENKGKTIVFVLPDTGERYLSTPGFID